VPVISHQVILSRSQSAASKLVGFSYYIIQYKGPEYAVEMQKKLKIFPVGGTADRQVFMNPSFSSRQGRGKTVKKLFNQSTAVEGLRGRAINGAMKVDLYGGNPRETRPVISGTHSPGRAACSRDL
jgi:hypothetical protein